MEWIKIQDRLPSKHESVLVRSEPDQDEFMDYFVARHWDCENEWHMFMGFKSGDAYIRIERKCLEDDEWCEIM